MLPELWALLFQPHRARAPDLSVSGFHLGIHILFIHSFIQPLLSMNYGPSRAGDPKGNCQTQALSSWGSGVVVEMEGGGHTLKDLHFQHHHVSKAHHFAK